MRFAIVLAFLGGALAACGDDKPMPATPDSMQPNPDGNPNPDTPNPTPTLTSFTIDLILNQTTSTGAPKAFSEFSNLPDPDIDNPNAYASLF